MKKRIKSAVVIIFSFALTGAILTGCSKSQSPSQDTQQSTSQNVMQETPQNTTMDKTETKKTETETTKAEIAETKISEVSETKITEVSEKNDPITEKYEDNFSVDSKAAKEFAEKIKTITANKDLEALADLTAFPVYVDLPDVNVIETKEDFLKLGADTIFTEELLKSIELADIENFQPSMAGFSISDGGTANINFAVVDGVLAINGINY